MLGAFDAAARHIAVRRLAEGLLEQAGEMEGAEPHQLGQGGQRDLLMQMGFDIVVENASVTGRETRAGNRRIGLGTVDLRQAVCQHGDERVAIAFRMAAGILDLLLQRHRGGPQHLVEEEQARLEVDLLEAQLGIDQRAVGVEGDHHRAQQFARPLPAMEGMARRHEGDAAAIVMQGRFLDAVERGFAVLAHGALGDHQHMMRRDMAIFQSRKAAGLQGHRLNSTPTLGAASYQIVGGEPNRHGTSLCG